MNARKQRATYLNFGLFSRPLCGFEVRFFCDQKIKQKNQIITKKLKNNERNTSKKRNCRIR